MCCVQTELRLPQDRPLLLSRSTACSHRYCSNSVPTTSGRGGEGVERKSDIILSVFDGDSCFSTS